VLLHKYFSGILTGHAFYQMDHMNDSEADVKCFKSYTINHPCSL